MGTKGTTSYRIGDQNALHYITIATVEWADISEIQENPQESRREWLLGILQEAGSKNQKNKKYQVWRQDNHPIELYTNEVIDHKLDYIHNNPVEEGIVQNAEDYLYSSARNYAKLEAVIEIDFL